MRWLEKWWSLCGKNNFILWGRYGASILLSINVNYVFQFSQYSVHSFYLWWEQKVSWPLMTLRWPYFDSRDLQETNDAELEQELDQYLNNLADEIIAEEQFQRDARAAGNRKLGRFNFKMAPGSQNRMNSNKYSNYGSFDLSRKYGFWFFSPSFMRIYEFSENIGGHALCNATKLRSRLHFQD